MIAHVYDWTREEFGATPPHLTYYQQCLIAYRLTVMAEPHNAFQFYDAPETRTLPHGVEKMVGVRIESSETSLVRVQFFEDGECDVGELGDKIRELKRDNKIARDIRLNGSWNPKKHAKIRSCYTD